MRSAQPLDRFQQRRDFFRFAAVAHRQHHVARASACPDRRARASAGCRNTEGVPVLENVAAIFRPIRPDLPMPITTTRPLHASKSSTARSKLASSRCEQLVERFGLDAQHASRGFEAHCTLQPRTSAAICFSFPSSAGNSDERQGIRSIRKRLARDCHALPEKCRPLPRRFPRAPAAR